MRGKSQMDLYREFIEFIGKDSQKNRITVNRRMFNVLFWCFLVPIVFAAAVLVLINLGVFPYRLKNYLDWLLLVSPVSYAAYVLGSEVLAEIPQAFRRGGVSSTLSQTIKEAEWREKTCGEIKGKIQASSADWEWIESNFRMDLRVLKHRNVHMTALAGAVFFLIMKGIDLLAEDPAPILSARNPETLFAWIESASSGVWQVALFILFLVLFYISGSQSRHALERYLDCARLMAGDLTASRPRD